MISALGGCPRVSTNSLQRARREIWKHRCGYLKQHWGCLKTPQAPAHSRKYRKNFVQVYRVDALENFDLFVADDTKQVALSAGEGALAALLFHENLKSV